MKNVRANARYWTAGICAATLGVTLSRLVAPLFDVPFCPLLAVIGQLTALGGLLVICIGVRRRIRSAESNDDPPGHSRAGTAF